MINTIVMKKIIFLLIIGITASISVWSQSLMEAEYYFDSDPGVGNGTPVSIVGGDAITKTEAIDVTGLDPGFHYIFIRVKDDIGRWSMVKRHMFYVYDDTPDDLTVTQPSLVGLEYLFDEDLGVGTGTWVSTTPSGSLEEQVNYSTGGLEYGFHQLMVRARDASGKWGHLSRSLFYVFDDTQLNLSYVNSRIMAAEYFFDKDTVPHGEGMNLNITPGNEVEWTGGISVEGIEAGDHILFIRVRDSVGVWSIVYTKPFSIVGLSSVTNSPICQGSEDGIATVTIKGGKRPFTYLWDDPEQQSDSTATGLKAGTYTVTVLDSDGAVIKEQVEITEFDPIAIAITTSDTECKESKGSATAVATGQNPPFSYLWTSGSDKASATNLSSGIWEVTVTDNAGCQNRAVAAVNDIGGPQISTDGRIQHLECAGDANGIIDPVVSGGTPPYAYAWSNGETTKGVLNLTAGTYELSVTDIEGCIASQSVKVDEPKPITFSLSVVEADCGVDNGSATINVTGGSVPYAYNWTSFSAPHSSTRTGLGAAVYEVTVTDNGKCSAIAQVAISEKGAPVVNVTSVNQSTCGNIDGSIQIAVAGGTGSYTYNWKDETNSSVGTSKDLIGVGPGGYNVEVSDGSGCQTFATANIPAELPPVEMICLVSVDSASGKNVIVWNETPGQGIMAYRLYRETTSAGVFDSIAYIPVDSLSTFTDYFADPVIRSWRYRLSALNSCGVESRLSPPHRTMHLTLNLGLLNHINLIWNHYEGFVPQDNSYKIWRQTPGIGWEMIDVVPSNLNSYTDQSPPDADLWYYVEAIHPTGCTPLKASTLNSSRSNRKNKLKEAEGNTGLNSLMDSYNLLVYPNPSEGIFKVMMDLGDNEDLDIKVFDLSGKLVHLSELRSVSNRLEQEIDLSGLEKGMYQLHLKTERGIYNKMLLIQ